MKKNLLLSLLSVAFSFTAFSQVTNEISKVPPIRKGEITLANGSSTSFRRLNVINDKVEFYNRKKGSSNFAAKDIYKISKMGNYAILGGITSGLGGLLGSIQGTQNWNTNPQLDGKQTTFIIAATIITTAIGAVIGALIKKEKIVYKNSASLNL